MNYIKTIGILFIALLFNSCGGEVQGTFTATVDISLINTSNDPCYIWTGHSSNPEGSLILAGDGSVRQISLVVTTFSAIADDSKHDEIQDNLKVSVADKNRIIISSTKQKLGVPYNSLNPPVLRAIWDGKTITIGTK